MSALTGIRVIDFAINLPAPTAAMRLAQLGAEVLKIEPPSGDPLALACPAYYERLASGQRIVTLDLKQDADREQMDEYLGVSDVFLTAYRPSALERLGLGWETLHGRFPRLCWVALTAFPSPRDDEPGHDLMFQAAHGLLEPPHMPRTLVADLGAAERMAAAALALLFAREHTGEAGYAQVAIAEAGEDFALPVRYGLTVGGPLSGALPAYGFYRVRDGYVAIAALEPRLLEALLEALGLSKASREELERIFKTRTAGEWESWARERNLPLSAVQPRGGTPARANLSRP